jgi:hypothetical protein
MWWQEPQSPGERWTTIVLGAWCVLLLPWAPFALFSPLAFDAGYTFNGYVFFWSVATYPVAVLVAALVRRKKPVLSLLPGLNLVAFLISGFGGK